MYQALARHEAGEACVIPVVLRPMDSWWNTPIGSLQALPSNGIAVTEWPDPHAAFVAGKMRLSTNRLLLRYYATSKWLSLPLCNIILCPYFALCSAIPLVVLSVRTLLALACLFAEFLPKLVTQCSHQALDRLPRADGNAKNLCVHRFAPDAQQTTYEMVWPDGSREEIVGRDALLEIVKDERKLARITAKSDASIRQVMHAVKLALDQQTELLSPVKPRVLFSALGERHAEQLARIAEEQGIPCAYLHHSMTDARIRATRARFEQESGDLQGIVQLKMLGQGYDFPPITVVVPKRLARATETARETVQRLRAA